MKLYKKEDKLYSSIANFLIVGSFLRYIFSFTIIIASVVFFLNYQKHSYDHIKVIAQSSNQDSFFSFLDRETVSFNLSIETEDREYNFKNVSTPYSIKIPKGERIKVELNSDSKFICCKLKSGNSSVAGSLEKEMELERINNRFKIICL